MDETNQIPWPKLGQQALGFGLPWELNACLGWARGDMEKYINGYQSAAEWLCASAGSVGRSPDILVFPITFMWRHVVELRLKQIIFLGRWLKEEKASFPYHHRLGDLWTTARPLVEELEPERDAVEAVGTVVCELSTVDPDSMGFRYPGTKDGTVTLPNGPEHVNLKQLHDVMRGVATFLSCAVSVQSQRLDCMIDAERTS